MNIPQKVRIVFVSILPVDESHVSAGAICLKNARTAGLNHKTQSLDKKFVSCRYRDYSLVLKDASFRLKNSFT